MENDMKVKRKDINAFVNDVMTSTSHLAVNKNPDYGRRTIHCDNYYLKHLLNVLFDNSEVDSFEISSLPSLLEPIMLDESKNFPLSTEKFDKLETYEKYIFNLSRENFCSVMMSVSIRLSAFLNLKTEEQCEEM